MPRRLVKSLLKSLYLLPLSASAAAAQVPVDLGTWQAQSYPAVSGFGSGVWNVAGDGNSVVQTVNGQPTLFASDFFAQGTEVKGRIRMASSGGDDDFVGFALGYRMNDVSNAAADYLLVDWKRGTQDFNFGAPSTTPGGVAPAGLAVSRVTGIPTADELWQHTNFAADASGGLQELQRGLTLGASGWDFGVDYEFSFLFQPNLLQVYVDDVLQLSVNGAFGDGSMAFYNFSQADVTYSAFTVRQVSTVPEPSTVVLMAAGLAVVGVMTRRRRKA